MANLERSLIHIEKITNIESIPDADRIELVSILGWKVVTGKGEFCIGDKVIYIEIDSRINTNYEHFKNFTKDMDRYGFTHIRTRKIRGVYSQGLVISLPDKFKNLKEGSDLTKILNKNKEDQQLVVIHNEEYNDYKQQWSNPKKSKPLNLFKRLWYKFFKKKIKTYSIPSPYNFTSKTDETRIQAMSKLFEKLKIDKTKLVATEKVDGSSSTFSIDKKGNIYVASRNKPLLFSSNKNKLKVDSNYEGSIWNQIFIKYKLERILEVMSIDLIFNNHITIQGEIIGPSIQGNIYKLKELQLMVFNIKVDSNMLDYNAMKLLCDKYNLLAVPLLDANIIIPEDLSLESFIELSDGKSLLNDKVIREGIVYRATDLGISFKAISNKFLLSKGE